MRLGTRPCRLPFCTARTTSSATLSRGTLTASRSQCPLEGSRRRLVYSACVSMSVSVGPISTRVVPIGNPRKSARNPAVKWDSAAFVAEYTTRPGTTMQSAPDETLTMWPPPRLSIRGMTCRHNSAGAK